MKGGIEEEEEEEWKEVPGFDRKNRAGIKFRVAIFKTAYENTIWIQLA